MFVCLPALPTFLPCLQGHKSVLEVVSFNFRLYDWLPCDFLPVLLSASTRGDHQKRTRARLCNPTDIANPTLKSIDRLPLELLVYTFNLIDRTEDGGRHYTTVRLSQVCKSWRTIVQSTSAMWSHIVVDVHCVGHPPEVCKVEKSERLYTALSTYMEHSGTCPLRLRIVHALLIQRNTPDLPDVEVWSRIASLLERLVRRCRVLEVASNIRVLIGIAVRFQPVLSDMFFDIRYLEHLEELNLDLDFLPGPIMQEKLLTQITKLRLSSLLRYRTEILATGSEFSNIRHLTIFEDMLWVKFLPFSHKFTALSTLSLSVREEWPYSAGIFSDPRNFGLCTLPSLHDLHIAIFDTGRSFWLLPIDAANSTAWSFFSYLDLPSLRVFTLELKTKLEDRGVNRAQECIESFFCRTPSLTRLSFTGIVSVTFVTAILHSAPDSVEHLHADLDCPVIPILDVLSKTELCIASRSEDEEQDLDIHTHPSILPNLKFVNFTHTKSVAVATMSAFVAARSKWPEYCSEKCLENPPNGDHTSQSTAGPSHNQARRRKRAFVAEFNILKRHKDQTQLYMDDPVIAEHCKERAVWLHINHVSRGTTTRIFRYGSKKYRIFLIHLDRNRV